MSLDFVPFSPCDADDVINLLAADLAPSDHPTEEERDRVRQDVIGWYSTDVTQRTFWILSDGGVRAGVVQIHSLNTSSPMVNIHLQAGSRGKGIGKQALSWMTHYVFTTYPDKRRIEGFTCSDNVAMRHVFRSCGYVKEGHYRNKDGCREKTVYGILREDWTTGATTPVNWNDLPSLD